jgi:hypothetical protein
MITILGRPVPVMSAEHGVRATVKGQPIDPAGVTRYLRQKFGPHWPRCNPQWRR